ncbi:MAG: radical SAM protein [Oscillospiraceae bacterium]
MQDTKGCNACPRCCNADRAHASLGYCGQTDTIRIARVAPHYWEEPFLSGQKGSGTVFFCGCNLRCCYCQNGVLLQENTGRAVTPEECKAMILYLQREGVHNINLVTATQFTQQLVPILRELRGGALQIPVVWNSSGYESVETLRLLEGLVDIYLPDYKYCSTELSQMYSNAPDYPTVALAAIDEMLRQVGSPQFDAKGMMTRGVQVRHLVLPHHGKESRQALYRLRQHFGDRIGLSIMSQYTPMPAMAGHPLLSRKITAKEYETVTRYALQIGWQNALTQEGEAASESFIPDFTLTDEFMEMI